MKNEITVNKETAARLNNLKASINALASQIDLIVRTYIDAAGLIDDKDKKNYAYQLSPCGTKIIIKERIISVIDKIGVPICSN